MIKTIRTKFIIFAMAAVTILLTLLMLTINGFTWISFEHQSDEVLDELASTDGMFMKLMPPNSKPPNGILPQIDMMRSARYFIAKADLDGNVIFFDLDQIFYVYEEDAVDYAQTAINRNSPTGRIDRYKYKITKNSTYQTIYFLDLTREVLTMRTIFIVSGSIAVCSWMIVFLFVVLLSGKFVHPIINNLERQKQFITNAGHELKTPLAVIQSNNDAMTLIHGENKYNRNIKDQVTRLNELTSNLLMQAKLNEEVELMKEQINISDLTRELLQPYQDHAAIRELSFRSHIEPDIICHTNRQAFTQIITVLMDNAIKYTSENGDIFFSLSKESKSIVICEENSCDPEMNVEPEQLFERFYRADSARSRTDQKSGYGIGLCVARSICEAFGGKMTAEYPQPGLIRFTARI